MFLCNYISRYIVFQNFNSLFYTLHREQEEVLPKLNLSYEDLKTFYDQVLGLPCSVKDLPALKDFIDSVEKFKRKAEQSLVKDLPVLEKIA